MARLIAATLLLLAMLTPPARAADKAPPDATVTAFADNSLVVALAFSPDCKRLAVVGGQNVLKVWDAATRKELFAVDGVAEERNPPKFSPDGKRLYLRSRGRDAVTVVDVEAGKAVAPIPVPDLPGGVSAIDLSGDGKTLAVVGRGTLRLLDPATGAVRYAWEVHAHYSIPGVALSPDGSRVATAATDKTSLLMESATGKILQTFALPMAGDTVLFAAGGKRVVVYAEDNVVHGFDAETGEDKPLTEPGAKYDTVVPSADGKALVLAGPGRAPRLLPLPAGPLAEAAYDSPDFVKAAAVSPDGKTLAGGTNDGKVHFWHVGG